MEKRLKDLSLSKLIFIMLSLVGCSTLANDANLVRTVPSVDLQQYLGKWYEIASIPQSFQKDCVSNVTAEYAVAEKNRIKVLNSCETQSGKFKIAEGRAKVVNTDSNAELKVTFVKIGGWIFTFGGDYWVIGLGDKYDYAVVGHPSRKYAWILSRTPYLSETQLHQATKALTDNGYDLCQLKTTIQNGGLDKKQDLCQL